MPNTATEPSKIIGASLPRIDGPQKTTGAAKYAADFNLPGQAYAVPVTSTVAHGAITSIDTAAAQAMPGVLLILTHENMPALAPAKNGHPSEGRLPLADNKVSYWGQYIACVVADTFEHATAAAAAVKVHYDAAPPNVSTQLNDPDGEPHNNSHRGDTAAAFAAAPVQIDQTYSTPAEVHNPMEMHGTVAAWHGDHVTLYESSQGIVNHAHVLASVFSLPNENVQIISKFIGSGFGGKLFPWPHSVLAAVAARKLNRPVKLVLTRKMMFTAVGHRPRTQQRIRIGATHEGKILSIEQNYLNHTSLLDDVRENCGEATPFLYGTDNLNVTSALVRRTIGTPTPMRGPGAVPGIYALESAIDELALKLNIDPVQLRIQNDTLIDQSKNKPFSSRNLKQCYQLGAEKFGWSRRTPGIGSMRRGDVILGWGVAAASWGAGRGGAQVTVTLNADGTARTSSATQDIGTGTYTVFAQVVSDKTGIPVDRIQVVLGDSNLKPGPTSGGSTATATVMPAIIDATHQAVTQLLALATKTSGSPFSNADPTSLAFTEGRVHRASEAASKGTPFGRILTLANQQSITGEGKSGGLNTVPEAANYSTHSFGAQFAEVEWDPGIARLRVSRVVSVIDGGRIINEKTATNQISGAVVMGVGMALLEQALYDPRYGHPVNDNFADYLVSVNADCPKIDVHFLNIPDPVLNEYGARGIGEIGLAGVAPAITAAVFHATGIRVRDLPIRIEDLLAAKTA